MPRAPRSRRRRSWTVAAADSGVSARAGSRSRRPAEGAVTTRPAPAREGRRVRALVRFVPSGDRPGERDRLARLEPRDELASQLGICLCRARMRVVERYRLAMAWRLGQPDRAGNPRARDELWKVLTHFVDHLHRESVSPVLHGEHDREDLELLVEPLPHR